MKTQKLVSYFLFFFFTVSFVYSQNPQLCGMTSTGGTNDMGTIFKINGDGTGFVSLYSFNTPTGTYPNGSILRASDGKLYGMTFNGGLNNLGVLFSFDLSSNTYTDLYDFDGTHGSAPRGSLIQAIDGKLYGMTRLGGANNFGAIFSYDISTNSYTDTYDFDGTHGRGPYGSLIQANDSNFYGMTYQGGTHNDGVVFSFDASNNAFTDLYDFDGTNGHHTQGTNLMQASNGKLYGMTTLGGSSAGVLFSIDPSNNVHTTLLNFVPLSGQKPHGSLIEDGSGFLCGTMYEGGVGTTHGTLFSYNISTNSMALFHNFMYVTGADPYGSLIKASDGSFYGMTNSGGADSSGVIFKYDPFNGYFDLFDFNGINGSQPLGDLVELITTVDVDGHLPEQNQLCTYPNPSHNSFVIRNGTTSDKLEMKIINMLGKIVYSEKLVGKKEYLIQPNLSAGVYLLQLDNGEKRKVQKLVIEL